MNDSGHYYTKAGEPMHTIIGANKKERKTTLRDAKKLGLIPSVTTIFQILAKPELDKWKQRQVLLASMTLPRAQDESDDSWMERVMVDAFVQVDDAADLGTRVHAALENHLQGKPYDQSLKKYVEATVGWIKANGVSFLEHEIRVIDAETGYAGTTDAVIKVEGREGTGILDFKTRKSKPEYPMSPWSTEPMQIAAYGYAKRDIGIRYGVNVFISTTEEGRVEACWYEKSQLEAEMEAFRCVVKTWQHFKGYTPQ